MSGGLHGVGVSVVNALSEWLRVEIGARRQRLGRRSTSAASPRRPVKKIGPQGARRGTHDQLPGRPRDVRDDRLLVRHDRPAPARVGLPDQGRLDHARSTSGSTASARSTSRAASVLRPAPQPEQGGRSTAARSTSSASEGTTAVEVALQYNDSYTENVLAFANNINTVDGGTHLTGFRRALTRSLNDWARTRGVLKDADGNLSGDDVREGLTAVISVKLTEPQFEGQTKAKLGNAEVKGQVETAVADASPSTSRRTRPTAAGSSRSA